MNLATFLLGLVGPLAARFLVSMGLGLVTMVGLDAAASSLKSTMLTNLHGLPATALQLGGLFGLWECMGYVLGAVTFVITWNAAKGFWALAKK